MGIILVLKHRNEENSGAEIENLVRRPACPVSFSILTARLTQKSWDCSARFRQYDFFGQLGRFQQEFV